MSNDNKKKQTWTSGRSVGKKKVAWEVWKKKAATVGFFLEKRRWKGKKASVPKAQAKALFQRKHSETDTKFFFVRPT